MGPFFDWLEELAKEPVGLAFIFGAAALFWFRWLRERGQRMIASIKRIPRGLRQARIMVAWLRRKPLIEIIDISDVASHEDGDYIEYTIDLRVRVTNRDNGIAWVFIRAMTATLSQYRGMPIRYMLKAQSSKPGRLDFDNYGETQTVDLQLLDRFRVREFPTMIPIDFSRRYELRFSSVSAGIGATANVPVGHDITRQLSPRPKRKVISP